MCGAAGILSDGLLLPTLTSSSPPLTSAAVHGVLLMLPPNAAGQRMSSALRKSQPISELPTTTVISGRKGPPALVWTAGIFWPVQIPGSDAKACALFLGRSGSKETWKQQSKLVVVPGLFDQCDQKGEGGRSWWGFAASFPRCCRNHNAAPMEWAGGASTRSCLLETPG